MKSRFFTRSFYFFFFLVEAVGLFPIMIISFHFISFHFISFHFISFAREKHSLQYNVKVQYNQNKSTLKSIQELYSNILHLVQSISYKLNNILTILPLISGSIWVRWKDEHDVSQDTQENTGTSKNESALAGKTK